MAKSGQMRDANERVLEAIDALKAGDCWCDTGEGNPHTQQCLNTQRLRLKTVEIVDREQADQDERPLWDHR